MATAFANWIHGTTLGWAAGGGVPWIGPLCLMLHSAGLVLLIGCVGVFHLRLLGVAKELPVRALLSLMPWAAVGFLINLVTGVVLFAGNPFQYVGNVAFGLKMLFIVLAGLNVMVYYVIGLPRRIEALEAGHDAPYLVK